jgi:CDP-diacylglycerol--glycerol-3-phosphate 3-phosphatidyltransferase
MLLWLGRLDLQFVEFSYSELLAPVLVIVTAGREIGITGLRAIASSEGIVLAAERGGKIKTALQFVSISLLIFGEDLSVQIGQILLLISVGAALWSGVSYVLRFIKGLPA